VAEKRTIARPYARAMFMNVQDHAQGNADSLAKLLKILADAVVFPDIDQAIKNPSILHEEIINVLIRICEDVDSDSLHQYGKDHLIRWLALLGAAKRLECLPQIAELFADEYALQRGAVEVIISSAQPLTELQKNILLQQLSKKLGKTIQATYQNDSTLLGGVKIQAGDWVQDHSIADKLLRLSEDIAS
jgi:F-type H+-transporting ATPase subunit delta